MGRSAALLALLAALIGWYELAPHLDGLRLWPAILLISFVVMPACFLLVWLALPLWKSRLLIPAGIGFVLIALAFSKLNFPVGSNFCKLAALTLLGWGFLAYFEAVSWVVFVALLIPWVDAYSVWRGPTKAITAHHFEVYTAVAIAFLVPGGGAAYLGPPDVLFYALFLAAAARWHLRVFWTWFAMTFMYSFTVVLANALDVGGLPALPFLSFGFLAANADILWARRRSAGSSASPSSSGDDPAPS